MEASDREFGFVCLQAYNDFILDEWCAAAPGRYIPLILIPMWDPPLAVKEMERCAAKGATAFAFSENPAPLGLPTIHDPSRYWDPVMQAASDIGMVASMHVGSSSQVPQIAPDSPFMANLAWGAVRTSGAMLSWLFSGMFTRFPGLKIALSEGEIGWMPYFLERAEQVVDKQRFWVAKGHRFQGHAGTDVDMDTLDLAELHRGREVPRRAPRAGRAVQAAARQCREALPVHPRGAAEGTGECLTGSPCSSTARPASAAATV
jgi:hypothetical protein